MIYILKIVRKDGVILTETPLDKESAEVRALELHFDDDVSVVDICEIDPLERGTVDFA